MSTLAFAFLFSSITLADPVDDRLDSLEARLDSQSVALEQILIKLDKLTQDEIIEISESPEEKELIEEKIDKQASALKSYGSAITIDEGMIVSEAAAYGAPVYVYGEVLGDVVSFGDDIVVYPNGNIHGNAVSFGGKVKIEPGGAVSGDRVGMGKDVKTDPIKTAIDNSNTWLHDLVKRLVLMLCAAGTGILILGLIPDRIKKISLAIIKRPLKFTIAGILLSGVGLGGASVFAMSFFGIPISIFFIFMMTLSWLLGFVAIIMALGQIVQLGREKSSLVTFLFGLLVIGGLTMIPGLGIVLLIGSLFPSLGATLATRFGTVDA